MKLKQNTVLNFEIKRIALLHRNLKSYTSTNSNNYYLDFRFACGCAILFSPKYSTLSVALQIVLSKRLCAISGRGQRSEAGGSHKKSTEMKI